MNIEHNAKRLAEQAHTGQQRKYTGEPYINHPAEVVELVRSVPHTDAMLAAAWLHDVVEDTSTTLADIKNALGEEVEILVEMLTDVSRLSDGNRKTRKALDMAHSAISSPEAKTIKLADLVSNTKSIVAHDPQFAKVYLAEKEQLLKVLVEGDSSLLATAYSLLDNAKLKLSNRGK